MSADGVIEASFRARRDEGRKLLVPYVTGGYRDDWVQIVRAVAAAGADAIEVGIPFSDPVMDGPTIQESTRLALEAGATPPAILTELARLDAGVPIVVMTSYNICFRAGHERFASTLASSGVRGAILPELPLEALDEPGGWGPAAASAGVETVLLAAPTTPDERLAAICERSRGWVYGVGTMGVTGERDELASSAGVIAKRLKSHTDKPVLIGIGVSNAQQAAEVCASADGVIVGSALVRRIIEGASPEEAGAFVATLRAGIDAG